MSGNGSGPEYAGVDTSHSINPTRDGARLSICISTFRREKFIEQTLDSIFSGLPGGVEVIVVDGASPDETERVIGSYRKRQPDLRYYRQATNSGVDADYDKAVGYACGEYCWLMTDDDVLRPGSVEKVLAALGDSPDVLVVNAEVRSADLSMLLHPGLMARVGRERYAADEMDQVLVDAAGYLSFIGGVVIRRPIWNARERVRYYGSLFIHVGVIFQSPANLSVHLLREPLIVIRYGNAMWTQRGFEIWTFLWPALVWSFEHLAPASRRAVTARHLDRSLKHLLWHRAIGSYTSAEYVAQHRRWAGFSAAWRPWLVVTIPGLVANALCGLYIGLRRSETSSMGLYDLVRSRHCSMITRAMARLHRPT